MNSLHYPSLKLCKKLTEIGFPTTFQHIWDYGWTIIWCWEIPEWMYVSPSVMEMLDEMPSDIQVWSEDEFDTYDLSIFKLEEKTFCIRYSLSEYVDEYIEEFNWTLPNALAEMILWLVENKYLTFPTNAK